MPEVRHPKSAYTGPENRTCADCIHAREDGEVLDESLPVETRSPFPIAYKYICRHPNERVRRKMNTPGRFPGYFPCDYWSNGEEDKGHAE